MVAPAGGGGGGGGFGAAQQALQRLPAEERAAVQAAIARVPPHMTSEYSILLGKGRTALEIRDFISGEFEPVPLADVLGALRAAEKLGQIRITEKPAEPKPAPPKKGAQPAKKQP
jgi:hypothetical protein